MYQQERMDKIMSILGKFRYVTVDYLVEQIRYSPASIRRDLTLLEKQGLVTRSYGGVTLKNANASPFRFRQHSMKVVKKSICKRAAALVKDNDVVFIDGSSTVQYMGPFLLNKKGITVITSNMILADLLSEHGIETYCTGGKVVEYPGILGGQILSDTLARFNIDIAFFSSKAFDLSGRILTGGESVSQNHLAFRKHSKKLAYLCGSDKFDGEARFTSLALDEVDYFISDGEIPKQLKEKYKNTAFI